MLWLFFTAQNLKKKKKKKKKKKHLNAMAITTI